VQIEKHENDYLATSQKWGSIIQIFFF